MTEDRMFVFISNDPQKRDIITEKGYKNTFIKEGGMKMVSSSESESSPISGKILGSYLQSIKDELIIFIFLLLFL